MSEYIDRESIRKVLMDVCSDENCPMFIAATIDQVIDYEPAADVAPVVHGEWITIDGISRCSECGYIPLTTAPSMTCFIRRTVQTAALRWTEVITS